MTAPETSQFSPTRRRLLIGGGIAITGIGLVSWSRYGNAPAAWVERVVRDNLPGIALDEASLACERFFQETCYDRHCTAWPFTCITPHRG